MAVTWYMSGAWLIPEGEDREAWYGFGGEPYAVFDGWEIVEGGVEPGTMFPQYNMVVSNHQGECPLSMSASYVLTDTISTLNVHIEVTDPILTFDNHVQFLITEDDLNGHSNVIRAVLPDEPFTLTDPPQSVDIVREFVVDPAWIVENLVIVVFVQSHDGDFEVLQATYAQTNYAATIVLDPDPDLLFAAWHLDGPDSYVNDGAGGATIPVWTAGSYTVTWQPMPGWTSPDPSLETKIVPEDSTVTFSATYSDPPFTGITAGPLGDTGAGRGVSMVDYDRDGDLDIYVVNYNEPNLLLRNDGGDIFVDVGSGLLADAGPGNAAAWADYDNDGDLDLYLSKEDSTNILLENNGAGSFTIATPTGLDTHGPGQGIAWGDYNNDGLLDLYLVYDPGFNSLFMNFGEIAGQWFFFEMTGPVTAPGRGCAAAWADYDNDGDLDLYVTNRTSVNRLLENTPMGFVEDSGAGVLMNGDNGAGTAWADYNNDGDLDCYLVNDGMADIFAMNCVSYFSPLFGDPLGDIGYGKGVVWGDFDNDLDQDLFIARSGQPDLYLRNDGPASFTLISLAIPETYGEATGAACGDYDGDGDLDIYVACDGGPNVLLRNESPGYHHRLQVDLVGVTSNVSAVGACVRAVTAGWSQMREVSCGSGYYSQDSPTVDFGLWFFTSVDTLEITWPTSGKVQTFTNIAADQRLTIPENVSTGVGDSEPTPRAFRLYPCYPNPFNPVTRFRYDLPEPASIRLEIFDLSGRLVRVLVDGETLATGRNEAVWDGRDAAGQVVAAGTYFYQLQAGTFRQTERMTLVK